MNWQGAVISKKAVKKQASSWREKSVQIRKNFIQIIKISLGCCISVLLANTLGLRSSTSAGIITLLSIQSTKRETLRIAAKRGTAFLAALLVAYPVFHIFGYQIPAFGLFLFLFVIICYYFELHPGISMNTVLVTHLFSAQSMHIDLIINEFLLLCIGIGVGVLINFYMPKKTELIRRDQQWIDAALCAILEKMSRIMAGGVRISMKEDFDVLQKYAGKALGRAHENRDNTLKSDMRYYVQYMELRLAQTAILRRMDRSLAAMEFLPRQAAPVSKFMMQIADSFYEYDNAEELLGSLEKLKLYLRKEPLPTDYLDFESRAVLNQIISDLEYFLLSKKRFAESLTDWQIHYFWNETRTQ